MHINLCEFCRRAEYPAVDQALSTNRQGFTGNTNFAKQLEVRPRAASWFHANAAPA